MADERIDLAQLAETLRKRLVDSPIGYALRDAYRKVVPPGKPDWYNPNKNEGGPREIVNPDTRAEQPRNAQEALALRPDDPRNNYNRTTEAARGVLHEFTTKPIADIARALSSGSSGPEQMEGLAAAMGFLFPGMRGVKPLAQPARAANAVGAPASSYDGMMRGVANAMGEAPAAPMVVPKAGNYNQPGIRAYHGSPHDFDKFDMSRIGTGEGAQAYGHGLYFAENPIVAQTYKDKLTKPNIPLAVSYEKAGDSLIAIDATGATLGRIEPAPGRGFFVHAGGGWKGPNDPRGVINRHVPSLEEAKKILESPTQPGRMYEVNINARPEQFLDWDKPLAQQARTAEGAAQLREAGIPGIKYLDQGSRSAGQGTNNYTLFDDSIIDILKKYAFPGMIPAAGAAIATASDTEPAL